ncbi:MAG: hypothetical protein K0U93_04920 [Gammaproteobacteria bacterium]|nr:hypothetical protein [Gammaproteobacteria bacterium]
MRELLDIATREFPDNPTMGKDFAVRFRAMLDLVSRELVEDWVTRDESGHPIKLHPALLLAAAEVRMTKTSRFPMKRFRARVFEIIAEEVA